MFRGNTYHTYSDIIYKSAVEFTIFVVALNTNYSY